MAASKQPPDTPETGQNGQSGRSKAHFELTLEDDGRWYWTLYAKNGRKLAENRDGYTRRNDCTSAVAAMLKALSEGTPEVLVEVDNRTLFGNGETSGQGE